MASRLAGVRHAAPLLLALPLASGCDGTLARPESATGARADETRASLRLPGSDHGGSPLTASLTGAAEVPDPGDPDGSGTAAVTLNPGQREVCFVLTVEDIAPATAAHIHVGPEGVAGPIVGGSRPPTDGTSSGCVTDVGRGLIRAIVRNPAGYYVNVHNAEYPAGAVRGQFER